MLLSSSALSSLAVLLYWFKMRRLVVPARLLYLPQLSLLFLSLLVIVTMPQMAALALRYGQGSGSRFVRVSIRAQMVGLAALIVLAALEIHCFWFNNQYILLVPVVLLAEELLTASWMGRR